MFICAEKKTDKSKNMRFLPANNGRSLQWDDGRFYYYLSYYLAALFSYELGYSVYD